MQTNIPVLLLKAMFTFCFYVKFCIIYTYQGPAQTLGRGGRQGRSQEMIKGSPTLLIVGTGSGVLPQWNLVGSGDIFLGPGWKYAVYRTAWRVWPSLAKSLVGGLGFKNVNFLYYRAPSWHVFILKILSFICFFQLLWWAACQSAG